MPPPRHLTLLVFWAVFLRVDAKLLLSALQSSLGYSILLRCFANFSCADRSVAQERLEKFLGVVARDRRLGLGRGLHRFGGGDVHGLGVPHDVRPQDRGSRALAGADFALFDIEGERLLFGVGEIVLASDE